MATHIETNERILAAIGKMGTLGSSALHHCKDLRNAAARLQPITAEHFADFLEAAQPIVTEMAQDEARLEEQIGEYRAIFHALNRFRKLVLGETGR